MSKTKSCSVEVMIWWNAKNIDNHTSVSIICVCVQAQSRLTLCNPMDYRPPGSSVHGVF